MGAVSRYKLVVYILLSAKRRAYFYRSIPIQMRGVPRYFSTVSGSGVDWTLLKLPITICTGAHDKMTSAKVKRRRQEGATAKVLRRIFSKTVASRKGGVWARPPPRGTPRATVHQQCRCLNHLCTHGLFLSLM